MKKTLIAMIIAATAGFTFAQDAPPPAPPADDAKPQEAKPAMPPQEAKGGKPGQKKNEAFERLTRDMKIIVVQYDINKDGKLDAEEQAAAEKDLDLQELQKKVRLARTYQIFKSLDTDKDGILSEEEKANAPAMINRGIPGGGPRGVRPDNRRQGNQPRKGGKPAWEKPQPAPAE